MCALDKDGRQLKLVKERVTILSAVAAQFDIKTLQAHNNVCNCIS